MGFEDLEKWYKENMDSLDLNDKQQYLKSVEAISYLFNEKLGNWDKDDAIFVINCFARMALKSFELTENTRITILSDEEYEKKYGENSRAVCVNHGDDTYSVVYSPIVVKQLLSNTIDGLLSGLQTVFHEVVHARQNHVIQSAKEKQTKKRYLMTLETIARQLDPEFYEEYYNYLIKENQAQFYGLKLAMSMIKVYNKDLYLQYDQDYINTILDGYKKNFYGKTLVTKQGTQYDFMLHEEAMAARYIEKNPRNITKLSKFATFI